MLDLNNYFSLVALQKSFDEKVINKQAINSPEKTGFSDFIDRLNTSSSMEDIFQRAANTYDVPVSLLKAMAKQESNFNPNAVSSAGAQGVMQLMPATAASLGVTNSFDPEQNIMGGAKYIRQMLDRYNGDVKLALAAYNAGSGNVAKYGGIPPFAETQNYVRKVMAYAGENISADEYLASTGALANTSAQGLAASASDGYLNILNGVKYFDDFTPEDYKNFSEYLKETLLLNAQNSLSQSGVWSEKNINNIF